MIDHESPVKLRVLEYEEKRRDEKGDEHADVGHGPDGSVA